MQAAAAVARPSLSLKLLVPGLVASVVMGMWQMMVEAILPGGAGFWSPVVYIAATLQRDLQSASAPVAFQPLAVALGLMGHMMNSVVFGLIFAFLIAPRFRSLAGQALAGLVYGTAIFAAMWFAVLPFVNPALLQLNALAFAAGHMMWGAALGLLNHRFAAES